jgi:Mrp family chromosome partitioning ATPase/capsular polysaccharide biosynthesis protein
VIDDIGRPGRPMADYVRVIRRGWWIVLTTVVFVTAVTYFVSSRQAAQFQATADDVITTFNLNNPTSNQHTSSGSAQQYVATMAQVAQSEQVAAAALARVPDIPNMTPRKLLTASTVTADPTATIVEFKVNYRTKAGAVALANAYAQAFAEYNKQQTTKRVNDLKAQAEDTAASYHHLATVAYNKWQADKNAGLPAATVQSEFKNYTELNGKAGRADTNVIEIQSQADATLGQIQVQSKASGAAQLAPNTKRNTVVGVILGLVLGIGLVFAREAFDTRIRSAEQVAAELGLPLFGRLPRPDKDMRKHDQLTLLADPHGIHSEAYKKLRVSLDFANLDPQAQMLLVTSAVAQEGKSTTAANLAVAMAASGKNVILVDLDLRAPYLDRFFGLTGRPGVTDVILGNATLDEALVPVVVPGAPDPGARRNGHGNEPSGSLLHVLIAGEPPSDPSSLLASKALATLLAELRERAETIVIDTPPVLPVADTMGLTSQADAYMVVSKLDLVRRPMLHELRRELGTARALGLGVVVTDAESESGYGYGGAYGYGGYGTPADQPTRTRAGQ